MSAVIPFNCSNNHTTDHFGREDAIVRRENLQIQYEIIEEWGYLSIDTKTYRWIKRFVLPVCRLNTNTISL
ncbi:ISPg4 transposase [Porphyromonas gingivalis]|nr:ISPg4 transposase [Porphyromonas gingivalis]